jgi:transcriptional regulator with XRE-family HTH domain
MIGEKFREFRRYKALKVKEMADLIGISQGSLSDIENARTKPSSETISSIIRHTDINPFWLLVDEGKMTTSAVKSEFDADFIRDVIQMVEQVVQKEQVTLSPGKKAELVVLLLETLKMDAGRLTDGERESFMRDNVIKFIRLVS